MSSEGFTTPSEPTESISDGNRSSSNTTNHTPQASDTYLSPPEYFSSMDHIASIKSGKSYTPKKNGRKIFPRESERLDFLALPKKDFLDVLDPQPRPDGTVPERGLPTWGFFPLQTKIPADGFGGHVTMTKLAAQLFEPPPGERFDQSDMYIRNPPVKTYDQLFDPNMKQHLSKKWESANLRQRGLLSESGRVITTLKKVNDYRVYQRRILAERTQQKYRDRYEEERLERERQIKQKKLLEDEEAKNRKCQMALRSYIKNVVANTNVGSMETQRERDIRVLNGTINLQLKTFANAQATKPRRDENFEKHLHYKYGSDDWKKDVLFAMDANDIRRVKTVCQRQEKERIERGLKKQDLFERKVDAEIEWLKRGMEVEHIAAKDREDRIRARIEGRPMKRTPGENEKHLEQSQNQHLTESTEGSSLTQTTVYHDAENDLGSDARSWPSTSGVEDEVPYEATGKDQDEKDKVKDGGDKSGLSGDENWMSASDMPHIEKGVEERDPNTDHKDEKEKVEDGEVQDESGLSKDENQTTASDTSSVEEIVEEKELATGGKDKDGKVPDEDEGNPVKDD